MLFYNRSFLRKTGQSRNESNIARTSPYTKASPKLLLTIHIKCNKAIVAAK